MQLTEGDLKLKEWAVHAAAGPLISPRAVEALELLRWKEMLPPLPVEATLLMQELRKTQDEVAKLRKELEDIKSGLEYFKNREPRKGYPYP